MAGFSGSTYGAAAGYTDESLIGGGAIKGKNATVSSITNVDGTHTVTFEWTLDNGTKKTQSFVVKDGVDGKSAYELAVELGYTGTLEEWLASLKGETGEKGDKGVGIESITKQSTSGLVDTYLIVFADGTTTTYDVVNGANVTKTSQLENDNEFITNATIGLINYYLKDEVYNKSKIDELLRNVGAGLSVKIVPTLPTEEISGTTIYLINTSGSNYNQYMYIDGDWASLGSTSVDLSSYYNKSQIDTMLLGYVNASTLLTQLMAYTKTADLAKVARTNDYNDLDNLPEIPDVSGIKPYSEVLQDSNNTAPTSKVVYDAVQTINEALDGKADVEDIVEIDDTDTTSTDKVWSAKKINDSLVDIKDDLGEKADKNAVLNSLEVVNGNRTAQIVPWTDGTHYRGFEDKGSTTYTDIITKDGVASIAKVENGAMTKLVEIATMDKVEWKQLTVPTPIVDGKTRTYSIDLSAYKEIALQTWINEWAGNIDFRVVPLMGLERGYVVPYTNETYYMTYRISYDKSAIKISVDGENMAPQNYPLLEILLAR